MTIPLWKYLDSIHSSRTVTKLLLLLVEEGVGVVAPFSFVIIMNGGFGCNWSSWIFSLALT